MQNTDLTLLEKYLFELETTLLKPTKELYAEYLSDAYFEFGSSGNVWVRKDYDVVGTRDTRKLTPTQFQLHPLADDVVMITYHIHDEIREQSTLRSSIWKQFNGKWKMVFHQGTPTHSK
ncbi:DUF4440 domain-containing protein [Thermoactinomyces sp. DSM 45892]|uniref:nuclear transport factor 2 family protein n=1 Tax=Thermoactinomyces sp. DSM 45892 TaxID=1882753 RepID=UPI000898F259|nr:DUF4440 domain-containing protein [Thermoactinomyces sp. DSM 45892]SDY17436.1 hypothetical protein SAMN05444416_102207 [Thermoactinomyces sp. DSM 45892]